MGTEAFCKEDEIKKAARALKDGHLVAFPTETVYGLGADAMNEESVNRIYGVKGRPVHHPLIVHIASIDLINNWAVEIPEYAVKLAKDFWPGPMTLILKRSNLAKDFITGKQNNIGLRVPSHSVSQSLLAEFSALGGLGIAAPSANRFGSLSPTTASAVIEEIADYLSSNDLILNGGECLVGIESTIINCLGVTPSILRPGFITTEMIKWSTGKKEVFQNNIENVRASGLLKSHYAPKAKVTVSSTAQPGEGFIALDDVPSPNGSIRLASPVTIQDFAKQLYAALRSADEQGLSQVKIAIPIGGGIAEAIKDRIYKAAANKD